MIQATLFIKEDDPRQAEIQGWLEKESLSVPNQLHLVRIDRDPILLDEFGDKAPILDIGVFRLLWPFDPEEITYAFGRAAERLAEAEVKHNDELVRRITEPLQMTKSDRFSHWFSNHYMLFLNMFTFVYVFFAVLAPVLMKVGQERPARVIYRVYSPLCHQLAFRSFFLFGEQPFYPRTLAGMDDVITYGEASGLDENNLEDARWFFGNDAMGYKMALCQRDIAIYGAILAFGIIFSLTGMKIKPLPWYLWIVLGLGPIGLDGFSQLLSQTGLGIFAWLPLRESTPLLRSLTGLFFGLATAWFGFPYLEESIQENRHDMALKLAITKQLSQEG